MLRWCIQKDFCLVGWYIMTPYCILWRHNQQHYSKQHASIWLELFSVTKTTVFKAIINIFATKLANKATWYRKRKTAEIFKQTAKISLNNRILISIVQTVFDSAWKGAKLQEITATKQKLWQLIFIMTIMEVAHLGAFSMSQWTLDEEIFR